MNIAAKKLADTKDQGSNLKTEAAWQIRLREGA
jgi:hypothetical protein